MVFDKKVSDYLNSVGWFSERKVELPEGYSRYAMSDKAKNIIANLYGLIFLDDYHYKRTFILDELDFDGSDEYVEEACEDYQMSLVLYPLGTMSEYAGYLSIDDQGNFYHLTGELYFLGANLEEFVQFIALGDRKRIMIEYPDINICKDHPEGSERFLSQGLRRTFFSGTSMHAPWLYDPKVGLITYPASEPVKSIFTSKTPSGLIKTQLKLDDWLKGKNDLYFLAESATNNFVRELALKKLQGKETGLYWEKLGEAHASISPYLLRLKDWQEFADNIANQQNWGILIRIKLDMMQANSNVMQERLLAHLKELTFIQWSTQESALLRVSDFDVLKVLLEASNEAELNSIFGPILEFAYWQQGKETVDVLTLTQRSKPIPYHRLQKLSEKQYQALMEMAEKNAFSKSDINK